MEKKEFKVGEVFNFEDVKLKVEISEHDGGCWGCYFYVRNDCNDKLCICPCSRFDRKDNKNVIFVKEE